MRNTPKTDSPPILKLRGHHLVCLHFFRGEGYSPDFVAQLTHILSRADSGQQIEVVGGPDDVCRVCPYLSGGKCGYDHESERDIQRMDFAAIELLEFQVGDIVLWPAVREKIPFIVGRWAAEFCNTCDWRQACQNNPFFHTRADENPVR